VEHGGDGEDVFAQAAACETVEDADAVQSVVAKGGLWSQQRQIFDDEDPTFVIFSVEVRAGDVEKSQVALERWAKSL
jgi:hypothetical protein